MTLENWCQALEEDFVLSLVIAGLRGRMLGKGQSKITDPPKSVRTSRSTIICCSNRVSYTDEPSPENLRRPSFSLFCQLHKGRLLSEDAMMRLVIWAWSACLTSCMICSSGLAWLPRPRQKNTSGSVTCVLPSKPGSQRPPQKHHGHTSSGAGSLDYLCLEPGKSLDENILVVTDHFTRYAQAYVTRDQTTQMTAKTLWDKFIVHYGLPKKILMDEG